MYKLPMQSNEWIHKVNVLRARKSRRKRDIEENETRMDLQVYSHLL